MGPVIVVVVLPLLELLGGELSPLRGHDYKVRLALLVGPLEKAQDLLRARLELRNEDRLDTPAMALISAR